MFTFPEAPGDGKGSVEVGPAPYHHRSDCNICRKQDGLKTGSALLDVPRAGGYIVEGEHFLTEHAPLQSSSDGARPPLSPLARTEEGRGRASRRGLHGPNSSIERLEE
jgi:hypothetical protein